MKAKTKRLWLVLLSILSMGAGAAIIFTTFQDQLVFFYSPTDIVDKGLQLTPNIRVGGLVAENSFQRLDESSLDYRFALTDEHHSIAIRYTGMLPPMFREGQGIVAEGDLVDTGEGLVFAANRLLTKHDENYKPPELKQTLGEAYE